MIDDINAALAAYGQKWDTIIAGRKNKQFFSDLKPTAVGWKTADRAEYDRLVAEFHDQSDMIVEKWMNGRWIAKVHLRDIELANGVSIIKVMQRRPGSTDAIGLDHVDFYAKTALAEDKEVLAAEPDLKWTEETNDVLENYDWLSVWFEGTEAKIKPDTVLDIIRAELEILNKEIVQE